MDTETPPFHYILQDATTTSCEFRLALEDAIVGGFFRRHNVLVLDRAAWHIGGYNTNIERFCWNYEIEESVKLKLLVKFFPEQSPEFNPIEFLWHVLVQWLQCNFSWKNSKFNRDRVAHAACSVIDNDFDHHLVYKCYRHLGYNW